MERCKEDLRIIKTKKCLTNALFNLLETLPFEQISVVDICNAAKVHRATFYNHFADKEQLLAYAVDEIKDSLFEATIKKEKYSSSKEMYLSLISTVVDFVQENKSKILLIMNKNCYEKIYGLLLTTIKQSVAFLTNKNEYKENYALPIDMLIDFVSGGITSVGLSLVQSKTPYSKEELIAYFEVILDEKNFVK